MPLRLFRWLNRLAEIADIYFMANTTPQDRSPRTKLRFVGVIFSCCKVYSRIYLPPQKPVVYGFCPKCGARMEILQTPSGSTNRFFTAR